MKFVFSFIIGRALSMVISKSCVTVQMNGLLTSTFAVPVMFWRLTRNPSGMMCRRSTALSRVFTLYTISVFRTNTDFKNTMAQAVLAFLKQLSKVKSLWRSS